MSSLHLVAIGINRYRDERIPDLRFARSDAEQWVALFETSAFAEDVRSHLLLDEEATRGRIMHDLGVRLPLAVEEDDVVIISFSGHGSPERDVKDDSTSRFLICHDTERDSLFSSGLEMASDLSRILDRIRCRVVLFVLDACFSGLTGGRGIIGPRLAAYRAAHRPGLRLGDLYTGSGAIYLSACGDDEVAWENAGLRNGVFSHFLMKGLTSGTEVPTVGIARLYGEVNAAVREFTNGRQNPMMWGVARGAALPNPAVTKNGS